ncbi:MAG: Asp-tRNA(Asn)/Glu-tRNA(Gln) amidotransferase subunit GatC [Thermoguttaceae bacterium]|jgi:aspartyl-tRNA(Asn)/glutamyl-tRNA(Gln) amidotransferase subunit C
MSISREEVEKVSLLSRLLLSDGELVKMTTQLGRVLEYIELLDELDTERIEPLSHALDVCDVMRDDRVGPSLSRDDALANAPQRDKECYLVPAVLGQ